MSGRTQHQTKSTDLLSPRAARDELDLEQVVWYTEGGEAYHRAAAWGPMCPDQIGRCDEHSLRDAIIDEKRPCKDCQPIDYRNGASQ